MEFVWRFFNINYKKRKTTVLDIRRILTQVNMSIGRNVFEEIFMPSLQQQSVEDFFYNKQNTVKDGTNTPNTSLNPTKTKGLEGIVFFKVLGEMDNEVNRTFLELFRIKTHLCRNAETIIKNFNEKIVNKKSNIMVGDRIKTTSDIIGIVDNISEEDGQITILVEILDNMVPFTISFNDIEEKLK